MIDKEKFNGKCQVIENNELVRKIITMYTKLFVNYQEAAEEIGVNRDTIARYNAHTINISLDIFEKIAKVVSENYSEEEIKTALNGMTLEELKNKAKSKNGDQVDHLMYKVNDKVHKILMTYTEKFPSKAVAAKYVSINPRTFKAYLDGQIKNFPRIYFWKIVNFLNKSGYSNNDILKLCSVSTWDEIFVKKERSLTLKISKKDLIEKFIQLFKAGSIRPKDIDRSLHNASKRIFGNLGEAIRATMKELEKRQLREIYSFISIKDVDRALEKLHQLDEYLNLFIENEKAIWKASPKNKRKDWHLFTQEYIERRNKVNLEIEKLIERRKDALCNQLKELIGKHCENIHTFRNYSLNSTYYKGEIIEHPAYGMGQVLRILTPRKMVVQFEKKHGRKILIMNNKDTRPEFWGFESA